MGDFEKKLKAEAKKMLSNFNAGCIEMEDDTYLEIIGNLNSGQRRIFDDFVERINSNCDPFYLYFGGNAGTGKSYAVTSHKSQGQTLDEVLIDFSDVNRINNGSFYTALLMVKYGSNLYLKDFKPEYIKANSDVEKKMESMNLYKNYNFLKISNSGSIFVSNEDEVKVGFNI